MQEPTGRIVVDKLEWKRIILHIDGFFENIDTDGLKFYFENILSSERIYPRHVTFDTKRFHIEINVFSANSQYPLSTGQWYLIANNGEEIFTYADPSLENENNDLTERLSDYYLSFEKSGNNSYSVKPKIHSNFKFIKSCFHLSVVFKKPPEEVKVSLFGKIKKAAGEKLKKLKKTIFAKMLSHYQKKRKQNKSGKTILFTSDSRGELGGNLKFVYDRMVERGIDKQFKIRFSFKANLKSKRKFWDKLKLPYYIATSDIILLDDYHPIFYKYDIDDSIKIIQLWHACGSFKSLGLCRLGKPGAPDFDTRNHKNYSYMTVSSDIAVQFHAEAFGLDDEKILPVGIARTDVFFDEQYRKETTEKMLKEFPAAKKAKEVILYAPTFRGNSARTAFFRFEAIHYERLAKYCYDHEAIFIIKMHPFVTSGLVIPEKFRDVLIDASHYREVNDILFIADLLITDYSSVIYEFSLLNRPMLFYAFDLYSYISSRDFFEPYEDIVPGKIVRRFDDLVKALETKDYEFEKMDGFVKKNFKYTDGRSTDRIIDRLILDKK